MTVNEKIDALRALMKEHNMDAYIIDSGDFHNSEYVGKYFKSREYMSGFSGSAGILVVTHSKALLWTDGRYFLQAENQLNGTEITLMKMGEKDVPSISEYLAQNLNDNAVIGFDGRTVSNFFAKQIEEKASKKNITFSWKKDLIDEIWKNRPALSKEPVWELDTKYTGLDREEKLSALRKKMQEENADILLLTALDEIAWLLNLRGNDVECTPVFLSYMIVTPENAELFIHREILSEEICGKLKETGVKISPYNDFYSTLSSIDENKKIMLDSSSANYCVIKSITNQNNIIDKISPVTIMKAVKTPQEMENMRKAHIKDGVAVTKFIRWLKQAVKSESITEMDAVRKLEEFRNMGEGYLGPSFDPIISYGPHGAIVHYEPTEETNIKMEAKSFCLADTGGHYYEGTTDITRTIALGSLTDEEKRAYTLVLKGHLNMSTAEFKYGVNGENLDYIARYPLWSAGLDYNHSTGHGVGYLLNVHEGPQRINWKTSSPGNCVLEEGMVVSNEPGVYIEGKFGIRHENLVMVKEKERTDYGRFMQFENLTVVPFDCDAIDFSLLNSDELMALNAYHKKIYATLSPYLTDKEREWLKDVTKELFI